MKNKWVAISAIAIAAISGIFIGSMTIEQDGYSEVPSNQLAVEQTRNQRKAQYRLAGYDGKLAVFIVGKEGPEIVFDIYLHHLPDVDRLNLTDGIDVYDYDELVLLIEDYTS